MSAVGSALARWARSRSFSYFALASTCCADEILNLEGCRYDFSRFGCERAEDHRSADLLMVPGFVNPESEPYLLQVYSEMAQPRWVMALGSCACSGGLFGDQGVGRLFPVDVYVPGCPPRPEAIMNGLLTLQEKLRATRGDPSIHTLGTATPGGA